jgi:hypothetical protein
MVFIHASCFTEIPKEGNWEDIGEICHKYCNLPVKGAHGRLIRIGQDVI